MKIMAKKKDKRAFLIRYSLFILLPITFLIIYLCNGKGRVQEYGKVKIISVSSYMKSNKLSSSGIRGGGESNLSSISMKYSVLCKTLDGRFCYVPISDYLEFSKFKRGMEIETKYLVQKKENEFRLTELGRFGVKLWLSAFLVMGFIYIFKYRE